MKKPATIDDYIAGFPKDVQARMEKIRATIAKAAPGAKEVISYGIAGFKLGGKYLIYFAGFKEHIGVYPVRGDEVPKLAKAIAPYASGKATLKFANDQPVPYPLIAKIVKLKASSQEAPSSRR